MTEFVVEHCRPSDRAAEIIGLFHRVSQPGFPAVFDRIYRRREQAGLKSWIALRDGRAVVHVSVSPLLFSDGSRVLTGGMLGDLMADPAERDFWQPVKLVRAMVADVRTSQWLDFLMTSYVPAAQPVFRAAGFCPFAPLMRYVLPLIGPYLMMRGVQHGERRPALDARPFCEGVEPAAAGLGSSNCFRPVANRDYYGTRMPRSQYPAGVWLTAGSPDEPEAMVLISPQTEQELIIADVLWRDPAMPLAGLLTSVARWAAAEGHRRLTLTTLEGSALARAAHRAGFLPRHDPYPLMLQLVTAGVKLPPAHEWALMPFVLSTW